jgi:hypothetical protein
LLRQYLCTACGRDFVEEVASGERYAVHAGLVRFDRLSDEVTNRWIRSNCPMTRLLSDDQDRRTRFKPPPDRAA